MKLIWHARCMQECRPDGAVGIMGNKSFIGLLSMQALLQDGRWHMATVSTLADGNRGFQLFIDGDLAGEVSDVRNNYSKP